MNPDSPPAADFDEPSPPVRVPLTSALCCLRCGYSLRGLRRDGDCPECGLRVWDSWYRPEPPPLPTWLRAVRVGIFTAALGLRSVFVAVPLMHRNVRIADHLVTLWIATILTLQVTMLWYRRSRRDWMMWTSLALLLLLLATVLLAAVW